MKTSFKNSFVHCIDKLDIWKRVERNGQKKKTKRKVGGFLLLLPLLYLFWLRRINISA